MLNAAEFMDLFSKFSVLCVKEYCRQMVPVSLMETFTF
jgi:hypothetical protein